MKNKIFGGILATLGFLLSPLSWWNDLILNIPLAYGFASLFSLISPDFFAPMMLIGYWLTNIIGLMMMHKGVKRIINKEEKNYSYNDFVKDIIISVLYSLIMLIFLKLRWFSPPF